MSNRTEFVENAMVMHTMAQQFVDELMASVENESQRQTALRVKAVIDAQSEVIRTLVEYNLTILDAVDKAIADRKKTSRTTFKNYQEES